ncbi:hypothetical protein TB1_007534 [Malus domestica]
MLSIPILSLPSRPQPPPSPSRPQPLRLHRALSRLRLPRALVLHPHLQHRHPLRFGVSLSFVDHLCSGIRKPTSQQEKI